MEVALLGWISADYDVRFWTDLIVFIDSLDLGQMWHN